MVMGSTVLEHKDIHNVTWNSLDGDIFDQVDHLLSDAVLLSNLVALRHRRKRKVLLIIA
jgi:hypothetical protein